MSSKTIIVMGVSACGKSTIGEKLSKVMGCKFIDGDDLHTKANIIKMSHGEALNNEDRQPWLERIRDVAFSFEKKNETGIIVCSVLKKSYREQIAKGNKNMSFLFLDGSIDLILQRIRGRQGHFMQEHMVTGQFATLERPDNEANVAIVDIDCSIDLVISKSISALKKLHETQENA